MDMIGLILSGLATVLLLGLAAAVVRNERALSQRVLSGAFVLLAGIEGADQLAMNGLLDPLSVRFGAMFLESLLPGILLIVAMSSGRGLSLLRVSIPWRAATAATLLFPLSIILFPADHFLYAPDLQSERLVFLGNAGYWFYIGVMLTCVVALAHVEATLVSTKGVDRWKYKFEAVGLIGILAVLIFYYSQGLLYRTINMNLIPVRSGVLIIAALLIGYARYRRSGAVTIAVSRHVLYRSLTVFLVGVYLLVLGLIGEGMRYFELSFGRVVTVFLGFTGGLAILLLLFSDRLRRRVTVLVNKHFYTKKHDYREQWLDFTARLATCRTRDEVLTSILTAYTETFGVGWAALYLPDTEGSDYVRVAISGPDRETPELLPAAGLSAYFAYNGRVFDLQRPEYEPQAEEAAFIRRAAARFIVPLKSNGRVDGLVVLGKQIVLEDITYEDYDLMKVLARQADQALSNMLLSEKLAEMGEMAAVARVSSFVIHDLKNQTSSLSLVLDNAAEHIEDPEFQRDMMTTLRVTIDKMKNLILRLRSRSVPERDALRVEPLDLHLLSQETVEDLKKLKTAVSVECRGSRAPSMADREEIKKVVLNLIQNALEAVNGGGSVTVETGRNGFWAYVSVADSGCGMTEEFMKQHLGKPFRTTKDTGLGIGLYQCKQIVEAHGGRLHFRSTPGKGSLVTLSLASAEDGVIANP